jgi:hypothetical protein
MHRGKTEEEKTERFMLSLSMDDFKIEVARLFAQKVDMPTSLAAAQRYFGSWHTSQKSTLLQMEKNKNKNNNNKNSEKNEETSEQINFTKSNNNSKTNKNKSNKKNQGSSDETKQNNSDNKNKHNNNNTNNKRGNNKKKNNNESSNENKNNKGEKLCVYCEIYFPNLMNTHWTQLCRKIKSSKGTANIATTEDDDEIGCLQIVCSNTTAKSQSNSSDIYYDTCATNGVIKDQKLLSKIVAIPPRKIEGVGGQKISVTQKGLMEPFGWQLFSKESKFNLLSHKNLKEKFNIYYDNKKCQWIMTDKNNKDNKHLFIETHNGLSKYCGVIKSNNKNNSQLNNKIIDNKNNIVLPTMEVDDVQYSTQEVERSREALELHESANHMALTKMLDNGSLLNCNVTSSDLRRARKLFGPCKGCLLGKMTAPRQPLSVSPLTDNIGELLHADIYYIDQMPYLITVDDAKGFISILKLAKGKATAQLNVAFERIINNFKSMQHKVKTIRSDREAVFLATENFLNSIGIQYQKSAPGQHVGKVERAIRTLKERYRSVVNSLSYQLPDVLQEHLNLDVVQSINITPNVHTGNSNPRELVRGVKIDAKKIMRAKFGDIVIAHIPNNSKNAPARSEIGIVVGRDYTDSGTIKFWGLSTQEVVARQKFTKIPVTQDIIQRINQIAALKKSKINYVDPIYMYDANNNKTYFDLLGPDPILTLDEAYKQHSSESSITRVDTDIDPHYLDPPTDAAIRNIQQETVETKNNVDNARVLEVDVGVDNAPIMKNNVNADYIQQQETVEQSTNYNVDESDNNNKLMKNVENKVK